MEKRIQNLEELAREAERLLQDLAPNEGGATLVTLSGELGAGKTTFTQAIARTLGITEPITSPTFVLEKVYAIEEDPYGHFDRMVHIDAYRLNGGSELSALGFAELMKDPKSLILLEWPERVADLLPKAHRAIALVPEADGSRTLTYA